MVLMALLAAGSAAGGQASGGAITIDAPDVHAIGERAVAAQHRNDAALETYEWQEHEVQMTGGPSPRVQEDKTYRVVPTGTGTLRLLLRERGIPISPQLYRQELETWARTLEQALIPNNPDLEGALAKAAEKRKRRNDIVDATRDAFVGTWLGREAQDGYICDKLRLDPNPNYQPQSVTTEFLLHARVTLWVDKKSGQVVRGEADIIRDISFGGGVLGKVYKGGHILLKQHPVTAEIWEPSLYQYDLSGRKFVFGFETHNRIQVTNYKDLGGVNQALERARTNIALSGTFRGEP
jgi:hypothetical protein